MLKRYSNNTISIRAPAKGATRHTPINTILEKFQSALPRRERLYGVIDSDQPFTYFNPRSREGSDSMPAQTRLCFVISIRAPAKGATPNTKPFLFNVSHISIRAPAKGATVQLCYMTTRPKFQSALPRRERHFTPLDDTGQYKISIRAPAKGATGLRVKSRHREKDFNPRSREGSDCNGCCKIRSNLYFNPRSREGSDVKIIQPNCSSFKFQSALPRRERRDLNINYPATRKISIRAPAKGATMALSWGSVPIFISIHAPAKGATTLSITTNLYRLQFQSTLPRRERRKY